MSSSNSKNPHRRLLMLSAAAICKEKGFDGASKVVLESLTEILQAYLSELTRSCHKFSEHSHRTTPDFTDVKMALAEIGTSAHALNIYFKREKSRPIRDLLPAKTPVEHKTLKTGMDKISQPSYIPNSFPEYPEVHAFVRTPALREPINQYELVRERVAAQKIATEESLVKFYSKTNPNDTEIFTNIDSNLYPAVKIDIDQHSYLKALMPNQNDIFNIEDCDVDEHLQDENTDQNNLDNLQENLHGFPNNNSFNDNAYTKEPKRLKVSKK